MRVLKCLSLFFVLFWTLPIEESSVESQMKTFIPDEKCLILLQNIFWASTKRKGLFTGLLQPPIGRCCWLIMFVGASLFIVHRVLCQTLTCLLLFSSRAAYDISFYTSDYDNESYMEIASRLHPQYLLLPQVPGDEFPMYFQEMIGGDFPAAIFCSTW